MADECIFCKLGNDNSRTIFENEHCYVIPDRFPSEYGHMLVISKAHSESVLVASDELVASMFVAAKEIGSKLKDELGADGIAIATNVGKEAGQIIFHFHIHVIPKYRKRVEGFMPHKELDDIRAKALVDKLRS
jgi:histidine triad (HIT) family protein